MVLMTIVYARHGWGGGGGAGGGALGDVEAKVHGKLLQGHFDFPSFFAIAGHEL